MSEQTIAYAKKLVSQMTLEEKMSQMLYKSPAIERLNIPAYNWWNEALHGVARAGVATMFPQAIAMAATFDKELLKNVGDVVSTEGRAKFNAFSNKGDTDIYKGLTFWAPNINIFRDPRWGRGHETFGEDPYLTAELGCAYVKGIQGEDKEHLKAAACAKHFAVHSGPEAIRHSFDAKASIRDMYDTYLYAFKRCVSDAKVEAVMGAYNRVNGEPACGSKTLLKDILRDQWGFEGHVVSDCWAVLDFHEHHGVTDSVEESAAMAVKNGCDLNCGSAFLHLYSAYKQGLIDEESITAAVERLMEVRIRLGMMKDYPSPYEDIPYSLVECKEHVDLSLDVARRSMVLLKNNGLLPLQKEQLKTIAVIGPNANSRDALVGNYVGTSSEYITPLEGIQRYVGDDVRVLYAEGCHLWKDKVEQLADAKDRMVEAVLAAEQSDVVVMCLGLDAFLEGEEGDAGNEYASGDKKDLRLPGLQQELLEKVTAVGKPVVLLLLAGSAMDLSWADENVDAIIDLWYPGARGGKIAAEALFGDITPCGKLPVTFYASTQDLPDFADYSMANRTYRYTDSKILYPFGYGLSYSNVEYVNSTVDKKEANIGECITVRTEVKNTGNYPVYEAVQLYVKDVEASVVVPKCALRGIKVVKLEPGETKEAAITLNPRDFALITEEGKCVVEPGEFVLSVGGQQPDKRSTELTGKTVSSFTVTLNGEATEVEF
ncbi:glycoside hydrolase family 3 C-terminal domain-containing protein [[Clostridium] polysaccharolyticum]|uniref:Beta-glucosidase n=1 Tax=[Clostridium] polysaccharolyticum TaxID=29364 RepID=A0A1H9ZN99_9FIRM|nr:glycoside hydrolase family 3 C-terminal domain-containing protein [[Clostridium] polysaccharolyticum]SES83036.1 beta-glucosidase [[Clostridium] polysaccharolyticum]